jgi:hypothetical protein
MTSFTSLLTAVSISLVLSATLVWVLSRPLHKVLDALCASGEASQFWVSFTAVMLFIAPLLFVVLFPPSEFAPLDAVRVVRSTLVAALFGAVSALVVVGYKIARASPRTPGA